MPSGVTRVGAAEAVIALRLGGILGMNSTQRLCLMKRFQTGVGKLSVACVTLSAVILTGVSGCGGKSEPAKVAVPTQAAQPLPGQVEFPKVKVEEPAKGKAKAKTKAARK